MDPDEPVGEPDATYRRSTPRDERRRSTRSWVRGCARSASAVGIGVRELARRVDLSPSSISQIETGKISPSVRTLYALASEFGVTVDEVLFDQPAPMTRAAPPSPPCPSPAWPSSARRIGPRSRSTRA